jgi:hypothetical protein
LRGGIREPKRRKGELSDYGPKIAQFPAVSGLEKHSPEKLLDYVSKNARKKSKIGK